MFSRTGVGAVITIAFTVLNLFGIELPEGSLTTAVEAVTSLVGIGLLVYAQLTRPDLTMGLIRKN